MFLTFVQVGLVEVVRPGDVHIVEAGDVPVPSEVLQQLDLAQGTLGQNLLAEDIGDLLDSNTLSGLVVGCGADNTIGALTKLFRDSVALVDNEVLVEDLEDLAALQVGITHVAAGAGMYLLARRGFRISVGRSGVGTDSAKIELNAVGWILRGKAGKLLLARCVSIQRDDVEQSDR